MTKLTSWKNHEIEKMKKDIDRLFDRRCYDFGVDSLCRDFEEGPSVEIAETEDKLIVTASIPGMDPDDLDVSLTGMTLTISGKQSEERVEEGPHYHQIRRKFGSFSRQIELPFRANVEEIEANFEKGILKMVIPKRKPKEKNGIKIKFK
jgi:HSP20 family protein